MSNTATDATIATESTEIQSQPLVSDQNFQLLKEAQRRISFATGMSPTLRIILNRVINQEQIATVENQFIEQLSKLGNV